MSLSHPAGLLAAYNSLTDKHLAGYFNNTRIRRHLLRSGLKSDFLSKVLIDLFEDVQKMRREVTMTTKETSSFLDCEMKIMTPSSQITRSGRILSEKEYKLNIMKRDHQKYIRECLAQAIFQKVLDMERYHQLEIKRKLETLAKKERIQRFKGEHTRQFVENNIPILSPRPPAGPKTNCGDSILVNEGHSSPVTPTAPRPYTAPGNMQPPIRLQPLPGNPAVRTIPKLTSGFRSKTSLLENEAPFPVGGKKTPRKFRNSMEKSQRTNPYQLPNIDSYMIPVPPPSPPPNGRNIRQNKSETWRRRRLRPTTAPNGLEPLFTRDSGRIYKTSPHSNAVITMIYLGKNVHLSYDDPDFRDEIRVYQQHCGGENLCVYKGKLLEKETFQFISKRHHGFPFSLTFFLNGMQVNRLSSCCEYKHRKSSRLGGKRGYFGFVCVERASPCYKCIIAMGLDKKPSLMKSRKEKSPENQEDLRKGEGKLRKNRANKIPRRTEMEGRKISAAGIFSVEEIEPGVREVRTAMEEMERKGDSGRDVWEDNQENTFKYEYEEDFEVDEEKHDEKANEEGQADDQMNGISKSPSEDEKENLGPEKESEFSSQEVPDADDNEKDEDDGCSESELEEDKQDTRSPSPTSSRSCTDSSDSEGDPAEGGRDAHAEHSTEEGARSSSSAELSENDEPRKSHLPIEESFGTKLKDQETRKADVGTKPLSTEESCGKFLEAEMERGRWGTAEKLPEKSRKRACEEEEEKRKSQLWEGSDTKAEDKQAGLPGVEGGVGQITSEPLAPSCRCHDAAGPSVRSQDDGGMPTRQPEADTSGAPNRTLVVEKRAVLNSNKESTQITQEIHTLEKEVTEESKGAQHRDADLREDKAGAAQQEKAGVSGVPLGEWKPTAQQPELAEELTEKTEMPLGLASGAAAAAAEEEGDGRLGIEEFVFIDKAAARDSGSRSGEGAPEEQALPQTATAAASAAEQGAAKTAPTDSTALSSQHLQELVALREAATPETGEAEREVAAREAGLERPDVDGSEEEAPPELQGMQPVGDAEPLKEDGVEETVLGGEEPGEDRAEVLETETPSSSSTAEAETEAAASHPGGASHGSPQDLPKEGATREETATEPGSNRKDDREETLPEQLGGARDMRKFEGPATSLRETGSGKKVVTWADTLKDEGASEEEQKVEEEEEKTPKEVRPEEQAKAPRNEMESDAAVGDPTEAGGEGGPRRGGPDTAAQEAAPEGRPGAGAAPGGEAEEEDAAAERAARSRPGPGAGGAAAGGGGAPPQSRGARSAADGTELSADPKAAGGRTGANTAASSPDVAGEETGLRRDEAAGQRAAAEPAGAEAGGPSAGAGRAPSPGQAGPVGGGPGQVTGEAGAPSGGSASEPGGASLEPAATPPRSPSALQPKSSEAVRTLPDSGKD